MTRTEWRSINPRPSAAHKDFEIGAKIQFVWFRISIYSNSVSSLAANGRKYNSPPPPPSPSRYIDLFATM